MVKYTDEAWAVPGMVIGSGKKRIILGSFEGDQLVVGDESTTVPLVGRDHPFEEGERHYSIFAIEITEQMDGTETWGIPFHIGNLLDRDSYDYIYEVLQDMVEP